MKAWLKVLNYIALALFGIAMIALGLMQPTKAVPAVFNLLPFGFALLAIKPDTRPLVARIAVGLNAIWAVLYLLVMWFAGSGIPGGLLSVAVFCVPIVLLCILNTKSLWPLATSRLQV